MGNFSRNTFDSSKNYTSVRLQQGVPLVDADWNEQTDIARNELYSSMALTVGYGFSVVGFRPQPGGTSVVNDFSWGSGSALLNGRVTQTGATQYSKQPWTDPTRAAADGTTVLPPLTTPTAARTDTVYLDVWEHEVGKAGDPNIVNPVIGVETAVRIRRDAAVRVAEGSTTPPSVPAGHSFLVIGVFNRAANDPNIVTNTVFTDLRPVVDAAPRSYQTVYLPFLLPISGSPAWLTNATAGTTPSTSAQAPTGGAAGVMPLRLPYGAIPIGLSYWASLGTAAGTSLTISVVAQTMGLNSYSLGSDTASTLGAGVARTFNFTMPAALQPFPRDSIELHVVASSVNFNIIQQFALQYLV